MEKVRPWCGQPSDRGRLKNWNWNRVICANVVGATSSGRFLVSRNDMHCRVGDKNRRHRLMTIILSNLNRFKKNLLEDSSVNLQLNGY